jgi:hypothetical protein
MMMYILDDKDNVILCEDVLKWSRWFEENRSRRIIGRTYLTPDIYVSTVFLATDHGSLIPGDKPILWETAVMGMKGEDWEGYERYETKEEAIKGHLEMVDKVRQAWDNEKRKRWSKINHILTRNPALPNINRCPHCHAIQLGSLDSVVFGSPL